jgi:Second Messenger Oligonucleotide or Dinucleotide Synthetase domain
MGFYKLPDNPFFSPPPQQANALGMLSGLPPAASFLGGLAAASPQPTNALAGLGSVAPSFLGESGLAALPPPQVQMWQFVRQRFNQIIDDLAITKVQGSDGHTSQGGVRACLNRNYWGVSSASNNSLLVGSWGKHTRVRPSRDIDILFLLPAAVYHRFQARSGNRQSQLLQEVKEVLAQTYSQTTMRADGQVVVVPFNTIPIEIAPGFRCTDGSIIICDTNNGGSYRTSTAEAEVVDFDAADAAWNGNARALARMMKQWQRECNVPLKSFQLERLSVEFLRVWPYRRHDRFWYDWMVRDFLGYLLGRANGSLIMPGTAEIVNIGDDWLSRAQTAYRAAFSACDNELHNRQIEAGEDWQKIFGNAAPLVVA